MSDPVPVLHVTAIIAAGGAGRRLGSDVPKQLLEVGGRSLLRRSVAAFDSHARITDLLVVLPAERVPEAGALVGPATKPLRVVAGGARRQDSVANAVAALAAGTEIVLVHDAARPFVSADVISRAIDAAVTHGAAIVGVTATDTVKRVDRSGGDAAIVETLAREAIVLAQTPQAFRRDVLDAAVAAGRDGEDATDEAALAERIGRRVYVVEGETGNVKITTAADLERARTAERPAVTQAARAGVGYDLHRLVEGRPLMLGGVTIPSPLGALGHSDADAAAHAVTDALLGAACLGDIGRHFPDTDPAWKGASSVALLRQCAALVRAEGFDVLNADVVVVLERPKIAPYLPAIRAGLAEALGVTVERVSVKGKTNEGVDAVGRGEAIAAHAVVLLGRRDDRGIA